MKNLYKQKRQQGFTIIEVLIVLAIAALILLIVFLAVPSLQRNSRNTQRKSDVSNILAGVADYASNNNGKLPTTCSGSSTIQLGTTGVATSTTDIKVGYYNGNCVTAAPAAGQVQLLSAYTATGPLANNAANDWVVIVPSATCDTATLGKTAAGSTRQIVAIYQLEAGAGKYNPTCQES